MWEWVCVEPHHPCARSLRVYDSLRAIIAFREACDPHCWWMVDGWVVSLYCWCWKLGVWIVFVLITTPRGRSLQSHCLLSARIAFSGIGDLWFSVRFVDISLWWFDLDLMCEWMSDWWWYIVLRLKGDVLELWMLVGVYAWVNFSNWTTLVPCNNQARQLTWERTWT